MLPRSNQDMPRELLGNQVVHAVVQWGEGHGDDDKLIDGFTTSESVSTFTILAMLSSAICAPPNDKLNSIISKGLRGLGPRFGHAQAKTRARQNSR